MGRDNAPRRLVGSAGCRVPHSVRFSRVRDLGCIPERVLRVRQLSVTVLFTARVRRLSALVVRPEAVMVAGAASVFTGADHPAISRGIPIHLLLLPRRLLQSVLV